MEFIRYIVIVGLIGIFFLPSGCNNNDKWKAVPLKINKRESFNYSEMISGKLDSTTKVDLEKVREKISEENKDLSKQLDEHRTESTSHFINTIFKSIKNTYNWFINLF